MKLEGLSLAGENEAQRFDSVSVAPGSDYWLAAVATMTIGVVPTLMAPPACCTGVSGCRGMTPMGTLTRGDELPVGPQGTWQTLFHPGHPALSGDLADRST